MVLAGCVRAMRTLGLLDIFKTLLDCARSRLDRRVTFFVLLTILLVETGILIPSRYKFEAERRADLLRHAHAVVTAPEALAGRSVASAGLSRARRRPDASTWSGRSRRETGR